jgi:rod shape-determining protein MreC
MEALLSRYRNLTILVVVIVAQLLYLAYQVKTGRDERLIRVWAVTAVTPMAGIVEGIRRNTIGFLQDYFILLDVRDQNRKLKADNDKLRMENVYFRNQLATAEHGRTLILFQQQTPSKTVAARVIGNSTVATAKAVFIDRGSTSGIAQGMAVVIPEGIVGKVAAVYPLVSQVLLITDSTFKVGVESQKGHVHGVLDCGTGKCAVEQIQNEDKVDVGEWFFTSGEDRIFPKGFPVGVVVSTQAGQGMKDVRLNLSGAPGGAEQVLVVLKGVHQRIPAAEVPERNVATMLAPPPSDTTADEEQTAKPQTEADKIVQKYNAIGKEQNHVYGGYGSNLPNFNAKPGVPSQNAANGTPAAPVKPGAVPPPVVTQKNTGPALLGARPGTRPPTAPPVAPQQAQPQSVLPLGAPRRKPTSSPPTNSSEPRGSDGDRPPPPPKR